MNKERVFNFLIELEKQDIIIIKSKAKLKFFIDLGLSQELYKKAETHNFKAEFKANAP